MTPPGGRLLRWLAPLSLALFDAASAKAVPSLNPGDSTIVPAIELALTTEGAVAQALGDNLRLRSLEAQADMQAHRTRSKDWIDNPEIRIRNFSTRKRSAPADELEVGIRWRPPSFGEARARQQRREVLLWEQKVEALRERAWLASRVRRACADVIMHRELARIAATRIDNESKRISQIKIMLDLGRRSIVYYTKAKMAVTEARQTHSQHLQALHEEERRLQRLARLSSKIRVVEEPPAAISMDVDGLLTLAYANRPEVRLVEERRQLAVDERDLKSRLLLPQLSFLEVSRHLEKTEGDWHELVFGVEIPLFNRNTGSMAASRLAVSTRELQTLAIREHIEDEVRDSFSNYLESTFVWDMARRDGEAMTQDATQVIAQAVSHGTVPADEILELERMIMNAQVVVAQTRREAAHALYFLYYALGIERPEMLREDAELDGN